MNRRFINAAQSDRTRLVVTCIALLALALCAALLLTGEAAQAQAPGYVQVSAGGFHTCALTTEGNVDCWGSNKYGQAAGKTGPFTQVSAGLNHTCALTAAGCVQCWGDNSYRQAPDVCPAWNGPRYTQVSAGGDESCLLKSNQEVECWGKRSYLKGILGTAFQVSSGEHHSCRLVTYGGSVDCWGTDDYGEGLDEVGSFSRVTAGGGHNCAIAVGGYYPDTVICWGNNAYGQSEDQWTAHVDVSAGHLHTCGITSGGSLHCWGYNFYGQVAQAPAGTFKQVSSGYGHSCAISTGNELFCWGRNDQGQATVPGLGGPVDHFTFDGFYPPVKPDPLLNVVKAGSAVPLKFRLGGEKGLNVIEAGYPASGALDCGLLEPAGDLAPAQAPGTSGLAYDPASEQYTYVWDTDRAWAGTCRYLSLRLLDGTEHRAAFQFK